MQSHAYSGFRWPGYTVGASIRGGGGMFGSSLGQGNPLVTGYRFVERGGFISGFVVGGIFYLLGATAASMPDSTSVSTSSYLRTNNRGETERVTTTTYTATSSRSAAEREAALEAAGEGAKGLIAYRQQSFELDVFTRKWFGSDLGDARGYRMNFLFTVYTGKRFILEGGFGFGDVSAIVPGKDILVEEKYVGIPVRFIVPWGPFYAQAAVDLNFRGLDFGLLADDEIETREVDGRRMRVDPVRPIPLTISVNAMLWRLHLSVGVETARPWTGQFGYVATAGARF
ncbi:hypothetical protein [Polyangium fumosum]|uniref:Uncharacterized protein n=1 Tax=Polyangium fumosum TaxID=889272 RepID=A0A4U1JLP8_9BACT|nr:hypothetical protein [Polyangium fumosum]TKD13050.1 hypothetical protein E8A74_00390 [Polyangium fumosum]